MLQARKVGVDHHLLLELNRSRLRGLALSSIIIRGTRLLIGGSAMHFEEYRHWTFPDVSEMIASHRSIFLCV